MDAAQIGRKLLPVCFALAMTDGRQDIVESWTIEGTEIVHRRTVFDEISGETWDQPARVVEINDARAAWKAARAVGFKVIQSTWD